MCRLESVVMVLGMGSFSRRISDRSDDAFAGVARFQPKQEDTEGSGRRDGIPGYGKFGT